MSMHARRQTQVNGDPGHASQLGRPAGRGRVTAPLTNLYVP